MVSVSLRGRVPVSVLAGAAVAGVLLGMLELLYRVGLALEEQESHDLRLM